MRLLLTGATGFVGRNYLLTSIRTSRYAQIILPVRSIEKLRAQFLGDGFDSIPANILPIESSAQNWGLSSNEIRSRLEAEPLEVVHCSGVNFASSEEAYASVNIEGAKRLLEAIPKESSVLILSSQAAAGPCPVGVESRTEEMGESPITWYGRSKRQMELAVIEKRDIRSCILRPPMILGPRDTATLPLFKMGRSLVRFKPGRAPKWFSFISVSDLCQAMFAALDRSDRWIERGRIFNVASDQVFSDATLIETAGRVMGTSGLTLPIPVVAIRGLATAMDRIPFLREKIPSLSIDRVRDMGPDRWVCSSRKFQSTFDWRAVQSLENTLLETLRWYQKSGQL